MSARRGTQGPIGSSLNRLVKRLDKKSGGGYRQTQVAQTWEKIAGPAVTAHTSGTHLRDGGEMVVYVDSPLWATELSALSEHYRRSVNQDIGQDLVRSVRFTVSRKVKQERELLRELEGETAEKPAAGPVQPVLLTASELAQVEMSVSAVTDEELREALLKATVADLQHKKGQKRLAEREEPPQAL